MIKKKYDLTFLFQNPTFFAAGQFLLLLILPHQHTDVLHEMTWRMRLPIWTSENSHSCQQFAWFGESPMWILTPPWLFLSLRGRRKRCQHDPGSRLWRGSGGKSKTVHRVAWQRRRRSRKSFTPPVSFQNLSHVQQPSRQMIPLYETSIVSREEAEMTGCL